MKKKIKLKECSAGLIFNDSASEERVRERVAGHLAERMIEEGFVSFIERDLVGYKLVEAKIYALKQIE